MERLRNGEILSANQIMQLIEDEFNKKISKRTAQRYINDILKLDPFTQSKFINQQKHIFIHKNDLNQSPNKKNHLKKDSSYLLTLNFLKSQLMSFKGTVIEQKIEEIIKLIKDEIHLQDDEIITENMIWDQNHGSFDYQSDPKHISMINQVVEKIKTQELTKVFYLKNHKITSFNGILQHFFVFHGTLYIACFVPYYKEHISLALQHIEKLQNPSKEAKIRYQNVKIPEFNQNDFTKNRFGVQKGETHQVLIEIDKEFKDYFLNRNFHHSQECFNEEEKLVIRLQVPITNELLSWNFSWRGIIKVKSPDILKEKIKNTLEIMTKSLLP